MAHQRQLIREAVKTLLVAAATAAGSRVYESRTVALKQTELPAIAVYTLQEEVDPGSANSAPRELKRTLELAVEGAVKGTANVDDALDALAAQVECAMARDETFGGKAGDSFLSATEIDLADDGRQPIGLVRLVYSVTYRTYAPDEDCATPTDDFNTADVKYSLGGDVHPDNQAHDTIDVSEED
jgi:hypothetical protein